MIEIAVRFTSNRSKFTGDDWVGPIKIFQQKLAWIRCRANSNFNHFLKFTPERTQSNAWLWEHQHKILNKLSRRLEHIIGLQVSNVEDIILASEAYQVKVALSWKVFFFILVLSIEFQPTLRRQINEWAQLAVPMFSSCIFTS